MASDSVYGQLLNFDAVPINNGEIVRVSGTNRCVRAQADAIGNLQGLCGASLSGVVGVFGPLNVASNGFSTRVRLADGLAPVAGETLYVSAAVAGRATNIAPAIAVAIGTIEDASSYSVDGRVQAVLSIPGAAIGGGGVFPGIDPNGAVARGNTGVSPLVARGDVIQRLVADWPLTTTRTFLLDPVNGNDANPGFSDAAGPFNPATQAKATEAGLAAVMPVDFAGRLWRLIYAAGAYATPVLANLLSGCGGWSTSVVRPTATVATAGATAFADDAADRTALGFTTATGMFAAGYNPVAAFSATLIKCLQTGGGAPGFAAEPALPGGVRIRFDSATTTVALRNVCRAITRINAADTVTVPALPAVPVGTDVFYIEMPGATFPASTFNCNPGRGILAIVGARYTGNLVLTNGNHRVAASMTDAAFASQFQTAAGPSGTYSDPVGGVQTPGMSLRSGTTMSGTSAKAVSTWTSVWCTTGGSWSNTVNPPSYTGGCLFGAGLVWTNVKGTPTFSFSSGVNVTRIIGPGTIAGLLLNSSTTIIDGLDITYASALPGLDVRNDSFAIITSNLTGAVGGVGATTAASAETVVSLGSAPTITGPGGDVQTRNGTTVTWAALNATGLTDTGGNRYENNSSTALKMVGKFSGFVGDVVLPVTAYLDDNSQQVNNAIPLRYPTSLRFISRIRLSAPNGTGASITTATLYKNGVATAQTCQIAAASPAGTKAVDAAHPILFLDDDDFDYVVTLAAQPEGGELVTGTLEGP